MSLWPSQAFSSDLWAGLGWKTRLTHSSRGAWLMRTPALSRFLYTAFLAIGLRIGCHCPKRQTMFFHTKCWILWAMICATGSTSIHFVKYSMATTRYFSCRIAKEKGPRISIPQVWNDQEEDACWILRIGRSHSRHLEPLTKISDGVPPLEAHHSSQDKAKKRKTQNSQILSKIEYSLSTIKFQSELYKLNSFIYSLEVLKMQAKWHTNAMKFGANLDNEGSVTFLPSLAPPNLLSTLPP